MVEYIFLGLSIILIVFLIYCGKIIFIHKKRENTIKNFESYIAVLQFHMEKAYDIIHKDQVLVYSMEATTLPDKEFNKATTDFIILVQKLLGPSLTAEIIYMYGNYDTFAFNLAEYFSTRYDNDEIRKSSIDEMMEKEPEH